MTNVIGKLLKVPVVPGLIKKVNYYRDYGQ